MSYYDHATHLALRLDGWDMSGENGTGDARLARDIHQGPLKSMRRPRKSSALFLLALGYLKRPSKTVG